jgi:hypothetical protein
MAIDFVNLNQEVIYVFPHCNLYVTKQTGRELFNNKMNLSKKVYTIPLKHVILAIPLEFFDYFELVTVLAIEWNIDLVYPRPEIISTHIEIYLYDYEMNEIRNNNSKVLLYFEKTVSF